jgi:hypothetical protein
VDFTPVGKTALHMQANDEWLALLMGNLQTVKQGWLVLTIKSMVVLGQCYVRCAPYAAPRAEQRAGDLFLQVAPRLCALPAVR